MSTPAVVLERNGKIVTAAPAQLLTGAPDREVAWAEGLIRHNPLYAWVLGRYVSAGEANANGHIFDADELRQQAGTLVHAPLNMLHRPQQVLGTYVGAELVYPAAAAAQGAPAPPFVESLAALWRYYFQEEYAIIQMAHGAGLLAQSMECIPKTVTCAAAECGLTFPYAGRASDTYCGHINGPPAGNRKLNMPHFSAGAIVIPPAVPAWRGAKVTQLTAHLRTAEIEGLAATLYDQVRAAMPELDERGREHFMAAVMALSGGPAAPAPRSRAANGDGDRPVDPHSYQEPPGQPAGDGPCVRCGKGPDSPIHVGMSEPASAGSDVADTAAMVALYPPADVAATLAVGAGFSDALAPDDLHITLVYLGPTATETLDLDVVRAAVAAAAEGQGPMEGWVSGIGRFSAGYPAGQEAWPLYASIDVSELPAFRQRLVDELARVGVEVVSNHGFTPHMTLAYVSEADQAAAAKLLGAGLASMAVRFDAAVVAWGDQTRVPVPFVGPDDEVNDGALAAIIERGRREAATIPVWDQVIGRSFSATQRERLAKKGLAMADRSFPIETKADLGMAIKRVGSAKDLAATKRHIVKRAKAMGALDMLPDGWT